jgi:SNF2 family DNA or RNA helicase
LDNTIPVPDSQPDCLVGGQIRHYQLKGLQWLVTQHNAAACSILGDEMGLGKTLQTVAFVSYLKEVAEIRGPHLIVAPVSVLSSWRSEFAKWCPSVAVATLHGHPQERNKLKYQILTGQLLPNVLITSYEMLSLETAFLSNVGWYYLIFDEAQVSGSGLFCGHWQTCLP